MQRSNHSERYRGNPNRTCYLSSDGRFYCYEMWDSAGKRMVTVRYEVGKDGLTEELAQFLAAADREEDQNDLVQAELCDPLFESKVTAYRADPDGEDAVDPWDVLPDRDGGPEDVVLAGEGPQTF